MMETKQSPASVLLLGGDGRMYYTAEALAADGCRVMLWGQSEEGSVASWTQIIMQANRVILPIPLTRDGVNLHAPNLKNPPALADLLLMLRAGQVVAAGNAPEWFADEVRAKGCVLIDYGSGEGYAVPNALATAEGAIALAIEHTKVVLANSRALVLGFGRIGKQLCRLLCAMGVKVTVCARKEADRVYARTMGCDSLPFAMMGSVLGRQEMVFNTVPRRLMGADEFARMSEDAVFFDLAPIYDGGEDERIIRCPSLPYRFAPKTAGLLVHGCVRDLLDGKGEEA